METDAVDLNLLRAGNFWTSASFARSDLYRRFPFPANELEAEHRARGLGVQPGDGRGRGHPYRAGAGFIHPPQETGGRLRMSEALALLPNFVPQPSA